MTVVELIQLINNLDRREQKRLFTLRELSALSGKTRPATGMALQRAARKGIVARVGNLWINLMHPPEIAELARTLVSPSYISFESALYHHGILSQSPRGELTVATIGRPRCVETPLGAIRFIHLKRPLFFGFDADRMALAEKAWLDLIYIRGRRGRDQLLSEEVYLDRLHARRLRDFARRFPPWVSRKQNRPR